MTHYYQPHELRPVSCYYCDTVLGNVDDAEGRRYIGKECPRCHALMLHVRIPLSKAGEVVA